MLAAKCSCQFAKASEADKFKFKSNHCFRRSKFKDLSIEHVRKTKISRKPKPRQLLNYIHAQEMIALIGQGRNPNEFDPLWVPFEVLYGVVVLRNRMFRNRKGPSCPHAKLHCRSTTNDNVRLNLSKIAQLKTMDFGILESLRTRIVEQVIF